MKRVAVALFVVLGSLSSHVSAQAPQYWAIRTIEGVVLNSDGTPAQNAEVQAVSFPRRGRIRNLDIRRDSSEPKWQGRSIGYTTTSDVNGRFRFDNLESTHQKITAIHSSGTRAVQVVKFQDEIPVELQLLPTTRVVGLVSDGAGRPYQSAFVAIYQARSNDVFDAATTESRDDGSFLLEGLLPGVWRLVVLGENNRRLDFDVTLIEGDNEPLVLHFPIIGTVRGHIKGLSMDDTKNVTPLIDGQPWDVRVKADSRFTINDMRGGSFEISAHHKLTDETSLPVQIDLFEEGQVVEVDLAFRGLLKMSGKASCGSIPGAELRVEVAGPSEGMTTTDSKGNWSVAQLKPGFYSVSFLDSSMTQVGYQDVALHQGTQILTNLQCSDLGGRVTTPGGFPVTEARVSLFLLSDDRRIAEVSSKVDGTFLFEGVPPGGYHLKASLGDRESDIFTIDLLDSLTDMLVVIDVGPGLDLRVLEPNGHPATRVEIHPIEHNTVVLPLTSDCTTEGLCSFPDLEFGQYDVLVVGSYGSKAIEVVVPSNDRYVRLVKTGILDIRLGPGEEIRGPRIRVLTEDGIIMPPASFLDRSAWQPLNGLVTMEIPMGGYIVELVTANHRGLSALVDVAPDGRSSVELRPGSGD